MLAILTKKKWDKFWPRGPCLKRIYIYIYLNISNTVVVTLCALKFSMLSMASPFDSYLPPPFRNWFNGCNRCCYGNHLFVVLLNISFFYKYILHYCSPNE